ncbi:hypothetical protein M378DRAFT_18685 [Amanita muscaria Koide BX008]|uniref:Uncharacterized protein n=1 Tax=Amanita muscaria (strain Koide BX008) TaxID=946122 RepID=A0A0C2SL53_AMAMK|nr:hypothetical protein M378DRAFT_18685 [Amanita muscaria Koide BX008]
MPPRSKRRGNATRKTLVDPVNDFKIPSQSWKIKTKNLLPKSEKIFYNPPEHVTYMGRPLLRIAANRNDEFEGFIYVPVKYEKLWRHLIYGAIYWERAFEWVEATVTLRENAWVKYIQYMICRRKVLKELMKVRLDGIGDTLLPIFMEFGIRHFHDWLHDSFDNAKKGSAKYMRMDPTVPANLAQFKKGYHGKMPAEVDPPTNDDWWNGQINLSRVFARHYEDTVDVMTVTVAAGPYSLEAQPPPIIPICYTSHLFPFISFPSRLLPL